jgi:hypothetical protein
MTDDLATWLAQIGLGAHAAKFISQGIDWDVLGDLSECDLKELGLTLGDRKRLAKGLASLGQARACEGSSGLAEPKPIEADRRQVTVMFVDLIDSTALAERFDPEELRRLLGGYHQACAQAIEAHEGHTRSISAMACSSISATRMRTKTMPCARCSPRSALSRRCAR